MRILVVTVALILLAFPNNGRSEAKFTRSQCLVRVDFSWDTEIREEARGEILRQIAHNLAGSFRETYSTAGPSAASKPGPRRHLYLQYGSHCDDKHRITRELMARMMPELSTLLTYQVSDEIIQPGRDTMQLYGDQWIDGKSPLELPDRAIRLCFPLPRCLEELEDQ